MDWTMLACLLAIKATKRPQRPSLRAIFSVAITGQIRNFPSARSMLSAAAAWDFL